MPGLSPQWITGMHVAGVMSLPVEARHENELRSALNSAGSKSQDRRKRGSAGIDFLTEDPIAMSPSGAASARSETADMSCPNGKFGVSHKI